MRLKIIALNLLVLFCFAIDRLTKLYFLQTNQVVKNNGVVFGWGSVNIIYYILVILIIMVLFRILLAEYQLVKTKHTSSLAQITIISFILIGALSNLIDRFKFGAVIDWISIPWWSVFNLADIYIIGATIIWCLYIFYGHKKISKT